MVTGIQQTGRRATASAAIALEADVILTFVEWSQGRRTLDTALRRLVSGFGARRGVFARINTVAMTARIAHAGEDERSEAADYRPAGDCAAFRILHEDLARLKPGAFVVSSQYMRDRLHRDPEFDANLSAGRAREISFVVLGQSNGTVDLLELYYDEPLPVSPDGQEEWGSGALARIYASRRPGIITDWFAREQVSDETGTDFTEPVLGPGNVAGLTRCEWRVCVLVSRGLCIKGIAYELDVAVPTVRAHLRKVYGKTALSGFHALAVKLISSREQTALRPGQAGAAA